ncbi:hypothetical protein [Demequina sp. NBRC 110053]|uniref:hypothetical protein n=1 Tax=Demequina sp. NBRC 110053 TaxID=1570342 RepID=UPI0009FE76AE|nr:hypothetical protein [Demequina sp. NBRC 110053]
MARGFTYADGASEDVELAQRQDLGRSQIQALAAGKNALVREHIARRTDLPLGTMVALAHDKNVDVRAAMAGNESATASILEHLAGDRHVAVLHALLDNPVLDHAIAERLAFHRKDEVRARAVRRLDAALEAPDHGRDHGVPELRERVTYADVVHLYEEPPARPVRTAPVRGYRPAEEA